MVLALLVPAGILATFGFADVIAHVVILPLLIWLFSGTPLLVSFIFALKLKRKFSLVILLFVTIAYSLWFVTVSSGVAADTCGCAIFVFFVIGPMSLIVMLPAWITAYVLNRRYTKQEP